MVRLNSKRRSQRASKPAPRNRHDNVNTVSAGSAISQDYGNVRPADSQTKSFRGTLKIRGKTGRPKMNWLQTVDRDPQTVNRLWNDAVRLAANRVIRCSAFSNCIMRCETRERQSKSTTRLQVYRIGWTFLQVKRRKSSQ